MINVELSQHDVYDFNIKTVKTTKEIEGKKLVTKHKEAVFKRDDIYHQRVYRFDKPNSPAILCNIEVIDAPFPFYGISFNGKKYLDFNWSFSTTIYAFKHGLIDGFYFQRGSLFHPFWEMSTEAFIVIDPLKRKEVHEYIEKEFKVFIENCNDRDFEYGVQAATTYSCRRIGKRKNSYIDQILTQIKKDHEEAKAKGKSYYNAPSEIAGLKKYGEEKMDYALATMIYYQYDFGVSSNSERNVDPITFQSFQEAEAFCEDFNKQSEIYNGEDREDKRVASPMIVNDIFDKFVSDYYDKPRKEFESKLKGGKDIPTTGTIGEMK